jgi:hypothetical protein
LQAYVQAAALAEAEFDFGEESGGDAAPPVRF